MDLAQEMLMKLGQRKEQVHKEEEKEPISEFQSGSSVGCDPERQDAGGDQGTQEPRYHHGVRPPACHRHRRGLNPGMNRIGETTGGFCSARTGDRLKCASAGSSSCAYTRKDEIRTDNSLLSKVIDGVPGVTL